MGEQQRQLRPDTVLKLFPDLKDSPRSQLSVLRQLRDAARSGSTVLRLNEAVRGNLFSRPYPYVTVRPVAQGEHLPEHLEADGDPWSDFFITMK